MAEPKHKPPEAPAVPVDEALVVQWQRRWEELRPEDRALIEALAEADRRYGEDLAAEAEALGLERPKTDTYTESG